MIVYSGIKRDFLTAVEQDSIAAEIEENIYNKMHRRTAQNEFRSWENSLEYMYKVLNDTAIPENSGVAIEYNIPNFQESGFHYFGIWRKTRSECGNHRIEAMG